LIVKMGALRMSVTSAINFSDLKRMAKRRLPKITFDFIEGGVDGEEGIQRNEDAFHKRQLVPRYMVDTSKVDTAVTLFGQRYSQPYGIAPTGGIGLFRPGGDLMLARAAKAANIPFILSGMATASIEEAAPVAPEHTWFQLYLAKDRRISEDMVQRAIDAGFSTLVLTVDIPGQAKRERNLRNGFSVAQPLKPSLAAQAETLLHPAWLAAYMRSEGLRCAHWEKYNPEAKTSAAMLAFVGSQMPTPATWEDIAWIRRKWPRTLLVKGVMHPQDAVRLAGAGVDGVIVSNHGGRQLDRSPAPIDVLAAVLEATGGKLPVLYDSGVRRGADIVTALAMGAAFCFVGRWTLYGVVAGGDAGASHSISMVSNEISAVMAQMGAPDVATLGPDFLMWDDRDGYRSNQRT
jgi:(S)-mandelate dehydrogenase